MRDIYKTAKKAQTAPVRGRIKAMTAQPRAVAQARKIARQTTGFQKGGIRITDSPTKVINRLLSDEKGKPHSTTEGKEASIKRLMKRVLDRYIKKGQQQGLNPADVRSAVDLVGSSKGSLKDFFEKAKKKQAGGIMNYKQGGAYGPLRGTSGSRGVAKAFRGKEGFKESQKLQRKLSLTDKLKMQNRGVIDKKTGRLHPEHERALKALSKKELKQLIKTGQNPRYKSDYRVLQPGSLASLGRKQWKKNKQTTKQEGKYFKEMKAKGIKKSGGVIQKQTGGHIPRRFRTSLEKPHKWTAEQFGGGVKGKPHSTQEGRIAAGERLFKRFWDKKKEEDKKRRMGPPWKGGAFARPKEAGMNMKKGGVVQKVFLGKLMEMFGRGKKATAYGGPANQGGPEPTRKQTMDVFKDKFAERHQKGGVMEKRKTYKLAHKLKNKDRLTTRDIERAKKLTKGVGLGKKKGKRQISKDLKPFSKTGHRGVGLNKSPQFKKGGTLIVEEIQSDVFPKVTTTTTKKKGKNKSPQFKKGGMAKGGLPYLTRGWSSGKAGVYKTPRGKHHMAELLKADSSAFLARRAVLGGGAGTTAAAVATILKKLRKGSLSKKKLAAIAGVGAIGAETYRQKTKKKKEKYKSKGRPHKESLEESIIKKIKKKANGGTVVMPTVGNDVRTRAYKHGALIHPRPRPTTVLHGRERARGVGIAKRGW